MLREWKINYIALNGEEHGSIEFSLDTDYIEIPLQKVQKGKPYNRAREEREFQRRIEEELELQ